MKRWVTLGVVATAVFSLPLGGCGSSSKKGPADDTGGSDSGGFGGALPLGGSAVGAFCAPGATQVCVGPGACSGGQACLSDGSGWGSCECGAGTGGTTAGSSGTSGASGGSNQGANGGSLGSTGGTPGQAFCPPLSASFPDFTMLSDFEGAEPLKIGAVPDGGSWMAETDGTGTIAMTVEEDPLRPGNHALHFVGTNHVGWGGDVAVTFVSPTHGIEGSELRGVQFMVRGTISGGALYAKLQNSDSLVEGCGCDPSPTAAADKACYGGYISVAYLESDWRITNHPWYAFTPSPFGYHFRTGIDSANLLNMAIVVQNLEASVSWDIWIDEVELF